MKWIILLLTLYISASIFAQTEVERYKDLLLELEGNMISKSFQKVWKSDKKTWEADCNNAVTMEQLTKLTVKLSETCFVYKQVKPRLVTEEDVAAQTNGLLGLKNIMLDDLIKWTVADQETWRMNAEQLLKDIEARKIKEQAAKREQAIKVILGDFEEKFKIILEDSKKGSFANTINGSKIGDHFDVKVKFDGGTGEIVRVDGDDIYSYEVKFDVGGDIELGKELYRQMLAIIEKNKPEGFEGNIKYDKKYYKNSATYFEFKAETFNLTAKRPSVLIYLLKDLTAVEMFIHEPVFKR